MSNAHGGPCAYLPRALGRTILRVLEQGVGGRDTDMGKWPQVGRQVFFCFVLFLKIKSHKRVPKRKLSNTQVY